MKHRFKYKPTGKRVAKKLAGSEPNLDCVLQDNDIRLTEAYTWYKSNYSLKESKGWFRQYANQQNIPFTKVNAALDDHFPMIIGIICRLKLRNIVLPNKTEKYLADFISSLSVAVKDDKPIAKVIVPVNSYNDNLYESLMSSIELNLDSIVNGINRFIYPLLHIVREERINLMVVKRVREDLYNRYCDAHNAFIVGDTNTLEYFSSYTIPQRNSMIDFYTSLLKDCDILLSVQSVPANLVVKQRSPKVKPPSKIVAKLQYMLKSESLNMVSINPTKIIGSEYLITYNTKYRYATLYKANDVGLSVKSTTILNYDEKSSIRKRVRDPKSFLSGIVTGNKVSLIKSFNALNTTNMEINGRINDDVLLLRVL